MCIPFYRAGSSSPMIGQSPPGEPRGPPGKEPTSRPSARLDPVPSVGRIGTSSFPLLAAPGVASGRSRWSSRRCWHRCGWRDRGGISIWGVCRRYNRWSERWCSNRTRSQSPFDCRVWRSCQLRCSYTSSLSEQPRASLRRDHRRSNLDGRSLWRSCGECRGRSRCSKVLQRDNRGWGRGLRAARVPEFC